MFKSFNTVYFLVGLVNSSGSFSTILGRFRDSRISEIANIFWTFSDTSDCLSGKI